MATMASFKKLQNDASVAGDTFDQAVAQAAFADPISQAGFGEGAHAGALGGTFESYSVLRAAMINHGVANPDILATLPSVGSSIQGQSNVDVFGAQLKALGFRDATDTAVDGFASFEIGID